MSRLIDVDVLKKELSKMEDEYKATLNENCNDDPFSDGVLSALFQVFKTINSQPTAFDVDKVLEKISTYGTYDDYGNVIDVFEIAEKLKEGAE